MLAVLLWASILAPMVDGCRGSASSAPEPKPPGRTFMDSVGRRILVPERVCRVFAAGQPAAIILYSLAPDMLLGWPMALPDGAEEYLLPAYFALPELGRLTGRGGTVNLEVLLGTEPDLILDYGSLTKTYASCAARVQERTGIPYALIDGAFERIPAAYRLLGRLLGREKRAERLAEYAEGMLGALVASREELGARAGPRVYYARGPDGLETGRAESINVELLELVGARNVAGDSHGSGLMRVSMEDLLRWSPEVILTAQKLLFSAVTRKPRWSGVRAVREGRVYLSPGLPFGWFDHPPSINRLIGLVWLQRVLGGRVGRSHMRTQARSFYRLFYHIELSAAQLDALLSEPRTRAVQ